MQQAAEGAEGFATCSITSGLLTTPPRPVPVTSEIAMPASSAARRAAGDDFGSGRRRGAKEQQARYGSRSGAGSSSRCGRSSGRSSAAAGDAAAAVSSISPRSWSTLTTSPSATASEEITPARGAGTSTVILSVSSSTIVSPLATESPFFFSQRDTVASTIDSPSGGTLMDIITLEAK